MPNPCAARIREAATVVTTDSDVASVFPTSGQVNDALRALARIIKQHGGSVKRGSGKS